MGSRKSVEGFLVMMIAWFYTATAAAAVTGPRDNNGDGGGTKALEAHSPFHGRVIFAVVSLVVMCAISGMLATRLKVLLPFSYHCLGPVRVLTVLSYLLALLFVFSAGLLLSLWDLSTHRLCYAGIELCLAFYTISKVLLYLILLERANMIRNKKRKNDTIYLAGLFIIVFGWGTIAIVAYVGPVASLSGGTCRIGLPMAALGCVLGYDIFINILLTSLYCWLTNKLTKNLTWKAVGRVALVALGFRKYGPLSCMLQLMMAKSVLAAVATVAVTAVNLAVLIKVKGHQQGWLCLTICCLDISWGVIIIHWLTSNPLCDYGDQQPGLHTRAEPLPQTPAPARSSAQSRVYNSPAHRVCVKM